MKRAKPLSLSIDAIAPAKFKIKPKQKPPWRSGNIINLKKNCRKTERQSMEKNKKIIIIPECFSQLLTASYIQFQKASLNGLMATSKWEEFAAFFRDGITKIWLDLNPVYTECAWGSLDTFPLSKTVMNAFAAVDKELLRNKVIQLKPSTCSLNPINTTFFKTVFDCI